MCFATPDPKVDQVLSIALLARGSSAVLQYQDRRLADKQKLARCLSTFPTVKDRKPEFVLGAWIRGKLYRAARLERVQEPNVFAERSAPLLNTHDYSGILNAVTVKITDHVEWLKSRHRFYRRAEVVLHGMNDGSRLAAIRLTGSSRAIPSLVTGCDDETEHQENHGGARTCPVE